MAVAYMPLERTTLPQWRTTGHCCNGPRAAWNQLNYVSSFAHFGIVPDARDHIQENPFTQLPYSNSALNPRKALLNDVAHDSCNVVEIFANPAGLSEALGVWRHIPLEVDVYSCDRIWRPTERVIECLRKLVSETCFFGMHRESPVDVYSLKGFLNLMENNIIKIKILTTC